MTRQTSRRRQEKRLPPGTANEIQLYFHCRLCVAELPSGESPREWAQIEAGWTMIGLQIWCKRHDCNVMHIDFEGHQHPANLYSGKEQ